MFTVFLEFGRRILSYFWRTRNVTGIILCRKKKKERPEPLSLCCLETIKTFNDLLHLLDVSFWTRGDRINQSSEWKGCVPEARHVKSANNGSKSGRVNGCLYRGFSSHRNSEIWAPNASLPITQQLFCRLVSVYAEQVSTWIAALIMHPKFLAPCLDWSTSHLELFQCFPLVLQDKCSIGRTIASSAGHAVA
jgi:hypothetical protein